MKAGQTSGVCNWGIYLQAGSWRVDVSLEQGLCAGRALRDGEVEFFLKVARCIAVQLGTKIAFGTGGLAKHLGKDLGGSFSMGVMAGWESMGQLWVNVDSARMIAMPVRLEGSRAGGER
jgi:hypothetical protein